MQRFIEKSLAESAEALSVLRHNAQTLNAIEAAAIKLAACFKNEGHVYSCGNGGSMCDAMHFAEEMSGKFRLPRAALGALAISDPAHLSCTANDFGYEEIFSRFVEGHGRKGDILLAISTSGKSPNVLKAATAATKKGLDLIVLTGNADSVLAKVATVLINTPAPNTDRIQELHIKVIHILIELTERQLFPENYKV